MHGRRRVLGGLARLVAAGVLPLRLFAADGFGRRLEAEVARLGRRVYAEQGIPMVLACEDVAAGAVDRGVGNAEVAAAFARAAAVWTQMHPEAPAGDVAALVEWVAVRDFASGGRGAA